MASDLSSYLSSRYLVPDLKNVHKKSKRKKSSVASGILITDDDDATWRFSGQEVLDNDGPVTISGTTAEFRRAKNNNWTAVVGSKDGANNDETAAADAIISSVMAESSTARAAVDELPTVDDNEPVAIMSDGTHAGLQSASTVSAQLKRRQREEREEFRRYHKSTMEGETVYRDATGKRIDMTIRRAEARRIAAEAEEKQRLAKDSLKGDVQLGEVRRRKWILEDAKLMNFARKADDEDMNKDLKEQGRWNDPMIQFLNIENNMDRTGKITRRQPVFAGVNPPNRYGIKPGYRWDGVDRSNGFESERFRSINRHVRNNRLDYTWQIDE